MNLSHALVRDLFGKIRYFDDLHGLDLARARCHAGDLAPAGSTERAEYYRRAAEAQKVAEEKERKKSRKRLNSRGIH